MDSSSDDSDKAITIALWVMTGTLVVILIVLVVYIIIYAVRWANENTAIMTAFSNQAACSSTSFICETPDYTVTLPTSFPTTFDKTIAMFCGQMVKN
jgi:hypothetical protein